MLKKRNGTIDDAAAEAEERQRELARLVEIPRQRVPAARTVVGLDVAYSAGSPRTAAAAAVLELATGRIVDEAVVATEVSFTYRPGLLAFREAPVLLDALAALDQPADLLLCDGQGLAHPRRCGLACHLGVVTGLPAVGCAKSWLVGEHEEPGRRRGDRSPLLDGSELVGYVLRTRDDVRPVYVSPGHRIGFDQACEVVLAACSRFRLPDPLRRADHIARRTLRG